jgi:hypothetical protein
VGGGKGQGSWLASSGTPFPVVGLWTTDLIPD